ncbi:ribonucleoside-diphosphate reductase subunit alpha [Symbiobacterium thermophilum]|nr:ribonucleoside-diphosphate reductase subunit alpha [Symbiobacterium thermophilum]MBY6277808.1 ribonucleoside-diphosphate reductase subunit alpha [Symbiobacterium thermophilum]
MLLDERVNVPEIDLTELVVSACRSIYPERASEFIAELRPLLHATTDRSQQMDLAARLAAEKTSVEEPDWQYVAARLYLQKLYGEAARNRGYHQPGYGDFYELVRQLHAMGDEAGNRVYGAYMIEAYSEEEIRELGRYIRPERDELFTYVGLLHLADRYLIKGFHGEILELPQERYMHIAMHLASVESDRVTWAKRFYDVLSRQEMTVATPTFRNAATPLPQLSSCFIDTVDDSLQSIYDTNQSFAQVSKHGGGMGIYIGKLRARGSAIRGRKGAAAGVIPWVRNYNDTAVAVDQLGARKGAVSIWLDVWHKEIFEFLALKLNNGDDRMRAHDIFPGVCVPDAFMRAVEQDADWHLFCPHEVRTEMGFSLEDAWGEEWERRYRLCVEAAHADKLDATVVRARQVAKAMLKSQYETGGPFLFFRDTVNRLNPNKHAGMVYCSNLCTEIAQNQSPTRLIEKTDDGEVITYRWQPGDFVVCNLASINLSKVHTEEKIAEVVPLAIRMLDNVIDLNFYPVPQAKITNKKYRAIGLGVHGYHQMLAELGIHWESEDHLRKADEVFELLNYYAVKTSIELAAEKGCYPLCKGSDWETGEYFALRGYESDRWQALRRQAAEVGLRNAYLLAIAPTSSTSLLCGTTASVDPIYDRVYNEGKKDQVIPLAAPGLSPKTYLYYKPAHQIDQTWSIRAAGVRQRHIDQSQSFNLYIRPDIKGRDFLNLYMQAWKNGLKTVYYVRSRSLEVTEAECEACQA